MDSLVLYNAVSHQGALQVIPLKLNNDDLTSSQKGKIRGAHIIIREEGAFLVFPSGKIEDIKKDPNRIFIGAQPIVNWKAAILKDPTILKYSYFRNNYASFNDIAAEAWDNAPMSDAMREWVIRTMGPDLVESFYIGKQMNISKCEWKLRLPLALRRRIIDEYKFAMGIDLDNGNFIKLICSAEQDHRHILLMQLLTKIRDIPNNLKLYKLTRNFMYEIRKELKSTLFITLDEIPLFLFYFYEGIHTNKAIAEIMEHAEKLCATSLLASIADHLCNKLSVDLNLLPASYRTPALYEKNKSEPKMTEKELMDGIAALMQQFMSQNKD